SVAICASVLVVEHDVQPRLQRRVGSRAASHRPRLLTLEWADPSPLEQRAVRRFVRPGPAIAPRRLHVADLEGARPDTRRTRYELESSVQLRHLEPRRSRMAQAQRLASVIPGGSMNDTRSLTPARQLADTNTTRFPNESAAYRKARSALLAEEIELRRHI